MTRKKKKRALFGKRFKMAVGGTVLVLAVFCAVFAPLIAPYDPYQQHLMAHLEPGFWSEKASPATSSAPTTTGGTCCRA